MFERDRRYSPGQFLCEYSSQVTPGEATATEPPHPEAVMPTAATRTPIRSAAPMLTIQITDRWKMACPNHIDANGKQGFRRTHPDPKLSTKPAARGRHA